MANEALALAEDDNAESQVLHLRAEVRRWRNDIAGALADYESALALKPDSIQIRLDQSGTLHQIGRLKDALSATDAVLQMDHGHPLAHYIRGIVLREFGTPHEAEDALRCALKFSNDYLDARAKLALVLVEQGRLAEAESEIATVLAADPRHVDARWHLSTARLLRGDFAAAWPDYESRLERGDVHSRPYRYPRWDGSALGDGTLLIYAEQGMGDEILFASCFEDAIARAGRCVIECEPRLERLFARSFPHARVVGSKYQSAPGWLTSGPAVTAKIPAGSLAGLFRNRAGDFPARRGYLFADPERMAAWRARMGSLGAGPKVGIAWTGGSLKTRSTIRSLALAQWVPILRATGAEFVNLQYIDSAREIAELGLRHGLTVHHWPEALDDYDETAALVGALDLVICVTTAVSDLAGAMGKPVWVMVPASPEWRFQLEGETMPWYPSMRLFRQQRLHDWQPVIERVAGELQRFLRDQRVVD
ncbi:MAG: tetratricopeptide repeat protein [Betaproteobacteria bacterium]|nr:tetratricopeptide repeat protein [Betaproteobacteria bacterium]